MAEAYRRIKGLIGQDTSGRLDFVQEEIGKMGISSQVYQTNNNLHTEKHLVTKIGSSAQNEVWFTANYDTVGTYPSANNNGSSVVALLGLTELLHDTPLSVGARIVFFDAGLDPDLVNRKRRNPEFKPGSERFVDQIVEKELDFIETFDGAIAVQAVGKGPLTVFEKTGRKTENSRMLNARIMQVGKDLNITVEEDPNSPNADNMSFAKHGLDSTVLSRYHEGAWHRMQTRDDGLSNVNPNTIDKTAEFLYEVLKAFQK